MRRTVAVVVGALVAVAASSCSSSPGTRSATAQVGALAGKTPAQILSAATAAAKKAGTAHYVLTAVQGKQSQTISGDASQTQGQQTVVQSSQHIQVVYVGGVAYVQGDSGGLTSAMGMPASVAKTYADKWIAVHSSDSLFKSIVSAVTLGGTLEQLNPSGKLTLTNATTVAGKQAVGVKGGLPGTPQSGVTGTTTLFVAASKPTVPLKFSGTASEGSQHVVDTGTFTNWGKPLNLTAPSGAVAYSSLPTK
ncbi:MAG: hypothetical protein P4L20_02405 [Acidimicrobiales bacterium]|nr:hypothetical protein [Acidimicrobiales bacterium]